MITTQSIQPGLRERITQIRTACGHESASHSFQSVFLWQKDLGLSVCLREKMYAVRSTYWGDHTWFFPCGEEKAVLAFLDELLREEHPVHIDVFPLIDIAYVLTALSMYGFALSEQIEQDRCHQLEIANQRASVMVLQMRPHFIYNTLMSIYCLCDQDPQKARQVTMDFTNYLRRNFNAVASDSTIPFSAELEHTRAYLAVEQAQFEDMLLVEYDTPVTNFRLPPLTLQPLVENSVKHGMNPYSGPLHVSVRTRRTEAGIEVIVEDNGPGFDPDDESKPHTTLANIRQRMEMMCGGSLAIRPRDGGGTVATVTIPDRQEQADPRQTS